MRRKSFWIACIMAGSVCAQEALPPIRPSIAALPGAEIWYGHLNYELMYFWNAPGALGNPFGAFPSTLCDDARWWTTRTPALKCGATPG